MKLFNQNLFWLVIEYAMALVLGGFVALIATSVHRQWEPWLLIAALVVTFSGAVLMRAWSGLIAVGVYALGWFAVVQVLSLEGPGGDVMLPGQLVSYVWIIGGLVVMGITCFTPKTWFSEREHEVKSQEVP